jgi:hypothetical protein
LDPFSYDGYRLQIDFNTNLLNGAPNPNFGRAYVDSGSTAYLTTNQDNRDTQRETAFLDLDFKDLHLHAPSWLLDILGHHVFTATNSYFTHYYEMHNGAALQTSVEYDETEIGRTIGDIDNGRPVSSIQYMGPDQANSPTPGYVPPTTAVQWPGNYQAANILYAAPASGTFYQSTPFTQTTPSPWGEAYTGLLTPASQYAVGAGEDTYDVKHEDRFSSFSLVAQDYWFDGDLISTFGFRNDQYRSFDAGTPQYNPTNGANITSPSLWPLRAVGTGGKATFSYGLVGRVPDFVTRRLPFGMDISVIYNDANNFQPTSQRFDVFGNTIDPVSGKTREEGFRVSFFNGKIDFKFAHYKSSEADTTNSNIGGEISQLAYNVQFVLQTDNSNNAAGEAALATYLNSPAGKQYLKVMQFQVGAPVPTQNNLPAFQSQNGGNGQVVGTSDLVSTGNEYEIGMNPLPNWRIAINANSAAAVTSNSGVQFAQLLSTEFVPLLNGPAGSLLENVQPGETFKQLVETQVIEPFQTVQLGDGTATQELRKWHCNVITNYDFTWTPLRGWGIGGAIRWMDKIGIGYPIINNAVLGPIPDLEHPFYGPSEIHYDAWISYHHALPRHIQWKAQLNLQSIGVGNKLIPIIAQPNGQVAAWRIDEPMTWAVTNTFTF